jgi:hypothetical protein
MLITLAFLPLKVSMMLAGLLTVGLLPLAIVKARRSAAFAAMTVAMLGMLWRGEAWKAAYREIAEQVSQLPPQCRQLLPKTVYLSPASLKQCVAGRYVLVDASIRFLPEAPLTEDRTSISRLHRRVPIAPLTSSDNKPAMYQVEDQAVYLAQYRALSSHIYLDRKSPQQGITADLPYENHNQNRATPAEFI